MADVTIKGSLAAARVKPLEPTLAPVAPTLLGTAKDGYDTYGVSTPDGDKLVLTTSGKPLKTTDVVTVDGKVAKVNFVENEANTYGERFAAPFKSKGGKIAIGVGAALGVGISLPFGLAFQVAGFGLVIGLALWGLVGAGIMAGGMAAYNAVAAGVNGTPVSEALTNGLAKK